DKDLAGRDANNLGIYRLDARKGQWDYVGGKVDQGVISVEIAHNSIYAVFYDKRGPEFLNVVDAPDPATPKDTLTIRFGLRKPTVTTLKVMDVAGKTVRTLCDGQLLSGADNSFTLPLADVAEGTYTYALSGEDQKGRKAESVTRSFTVSSATRGAVSGVVKVKPGLPAAELRVYIPDTSLQFRTRDGAGSFVLDGIVPGVHEIHIERPGTFPAILQAKVDSGDTTELGDIELSSEVLDATLASEVFTPNAPHATLSPQGKGKGEGGDGTPAFAVLELDCQRACTVQVKVINQAGKIVANLAGMAPHPALSPKRKGRTLVQGKNVILWAGKDDRGRDLPSGWYTLQVSADALGIWVPAATLPVLLDRGLVRACFPLPRIFSPNGDGFEDEVQISYLLEAKGLVTVEIRDMQGRVLAVPAKDVKQAPGPNAITWDGKTAEGKTVADGKYVYVVLPKYSG